MAVANKARQSVGDNIYLVTNQSEDTTVYQVFFFLQIDPLWMLTNRSIFGSVDSERMRVKTTEKVNLSRIRLVIRGKRNHHHLNADQLISNKVILLNSKTSVSNPVSGRASSSAAQQAKKQGLHVVSSDSSLEGHSVEDRRSKRESRERKKDRKKNKDTRKRKSRSSKRDHDESEEEKDDDDSERRRRRRKRKRKQDREKYKGQRRNE